MKKTLFVLAIFLIFMIRLNAQSESELCNKAIQNQSTAPTYLVITILYQGVKIRTCVDSVALLQVLMSEYGMDIKEYQKAIELFIKNEAKAFEIKNDNNFEILRPKYSNDLLVEYKILFDKKTKSEIEWDFSFDNTDNFHYLYLEYGFDHDYMHQKAIAHLLFENNILTNRACIAPILIINK